MLLDCLFAPRASGVANPAQWLVDWTRGTNNTDSGVRVDGSTILTSGPVFQATSIIAGDLGQLPLRVMRRLGNGDKERDRAHVGHRLFARAPNVDMLPSTFKELIQSWALLWGNGVAAIVREGSRPVQLVPLLPDRTIVERDDAGQLWYVTKLKDGREDRRFRPENVLHITGLSSDGLWGLSVIELMRNSVGLGLALEKHGNKLFSKGTRLSGVITRPVDAGKWTPEARQRLRAEWREMHEGLDAKEAVAVLQDGMNFQSMQISNIDAQWIEAMRLSRELVAAWFMLPPHKLGAMENSSVRANLEEQNRDYLNTTLMRWLVKWEEECNKKLLTPSERDTETRFFKWQVNSLLRGDTKSRYESYMIARTGEWLSPDEIRDLEDMNQRPDGEGGNYSNPNTRSPTGNGQPAAEQEPPRMAAIQRALIADRCRQLVTVEVQKVRRAAKKGGNFLAWIDEFYTGYQALADEYLGLSVALVGSTGVPVTATATVALAHAGASRRQLVELAGVVMAEQLAAQVEQLTERWPDRVPAMVDAIFEEG